MHVTPLRTVVAVCALAFLAALAGPPAHAQGSRDLFVGDWALDVAHSMFMPKNSAPDRRVLHVERHGDEVVHRVETWIDSDRVPLRESSYTAKYDGKAYEASTGAKVMLTRLDDHTVQRKATAAGGASLDETWTISPDGATLTIESEGVDLYGGKFHRHQVYHRQTGDEDTQ